MRTGNVRRSAASVALVAAVYGCGDDGNTNRPAPDSGTGADATADVTDAGVDAPPESSDDDATPDSGEAGGSEFDAAFFLGADITFTQQDESNGATYTDDDGGTKPILQILKDHGFNYIRLRTFVDPTQPAPKPGGGGNFAPYSSEGFGDIAHTVVFGQQIKAAGMGFLLDFHYSDYWADPGKQIKPAAWVGDDLPTAITQLHDYTFASIQALVAAGARPDMVQIGNEITPGMLLSPGAALGARSPVGWPGFAQLLNAGIQAVHEVDPAIQIMLHIDRGGDPGGLDGGNAGAALANSIDFIDNAMQNGVAFDVLGESCYVSYQGPPDSWRYTLNALATTYPNLKFIIAEYNTDPSPAPDPCDNEIRQANDVIFNLPNHQGIGSFFWEPTRDIGAQNPGMFILNGNTYSTNPECIDQYDQMKVDYGL
jgi:arabinogalactan endo-1,4-beta-galactosidase